jgi:hypothetical protein
MSYNLSQPVANVYVLPRATLELFEDVGDGVPGASALILKQLENVRVADRFQSVRTAFTGIPHPVPFHMGEEHEITADGIWDVLRLMERNHDYILTITLRAATWVASADSAPWHRIYYYVARTDSMDMTARDGNEMMGSQTITAAFRKIQNGTGTPSAPADCVDLP